MTEAFDPHTGQNWIQLSDEEVRIGFLSQCIEAVASVEGCDYVTMLKRMENVDMTQGYILECYDALHTQSWEEVLSDLMDYYTIVNHITDRFLLFVESEIIEPI